MREPLLERMSAGGRRGPPVALETGEAILRYPQAQFRNSLARAEPTNGIGNLLGSHGPEQVCSWQAKAGQQGVVTDARETCCGDSHWPPAHRGQLCVGAGEEPKAGAALSVPCGVPPSPSTGRTQHCTSWWRRNVSRVQFSCLQQGRRGGSGTERQWIAHWHSYQGPLPRTLMYIKA